MWLSALHAVPASLQRLLPVQLISFAVTGSMQVLISREQLMRRLLGEAGLRALLTSCFIGTPVSGRPYTM